MKKFLFLSLVLTFVLGAITETKGQAIAMTGSDTVVNAATVSCSTRLIGTPTAVSIQVILTKISGTVNGYTTLYGSLDGSTWVLLDTMMDATDQATNSAIYVVSNPGAYVYLQARHLGVGTMSAILAPKILIRKE